MYPIIGSLNLMRETKMKEIIFLIYLVQQKKYGKPIPKVKKENTIKNKPNKLNICIWNKHF